MKTLLVKKYFFKFVILLLLTSCLFLFQNCSPKSTAIETSSNCSNQNDDQGQCFANLADQDTKYKVCAPGQSMNLRVSGEKELIRGNVYPYQLNFDCVGKPLRIEKPFEFHYNYTSNFTSKNTPDLLYTAEPYIYGAFVERIVGRLVYADGTTSESASLLIFVNNIYEYQIEPDVTAIAAQTVFNVTVKAKFLTRPLQLYQRSIILGAGYEYVSRTNLDDQTICQRASILYTPGGDEPLGEFIEICRYQIKAINPNPTPTKPIISLDGESLIINP